MTSSAMYTWGNASMVEVEGLHARSGQVPVLNGVSLRVGAAERVVIIGRNGAGKTTLLRALMGFLRCRQGCIRWRGGDITHLPPYGRARLGLGYVPQGREIFPGLTVRENLRMGALWGGDGSRFEELLRIFPRLGERLGQRGGDLSGGEQQILPTAPALIGDPKLLRLDEPTDGVQPPTVDESLEQLLGINARFGGTMILVERNVDLPCAFAQRAYTMLKGQITEELRPEALYDPRVIADYLGV